MALIPFLGRLYAPGFHDSITVYAVDEVDAHVKATERACEPYAGAPYNAFRSGRGTVEVRPFTSNVRIA